MPSDSRRQPGFLATCGALAVNVVMMLGDFAQFSLSAFVWLMRRPPRPHVLLPVCYTIGVRSVPVIAVTGMFIGMVMAVQFYQPFNVIGLQSRLGAIISISIVRELGPTLAATMLAGRVGGAMSAELATMKTTEQVDALACLGAHPMAYLVVPRVVASVLLIPMLCVLANFMGVMGAAFVCSRFYGIEAHYYWEHTQDFVEIYDIFIGLSKSLVFGLMISLISCHRGLNSKPGAQGVGQAATEAFVISFVVIIVSDFFLGMFLLDLYDFVWGEARKSFL